MRDEQHDPTRDAADPADPAPEALDQAIDDLRADPVLSGTLDDLAAAGRQPLDTTVRERHLARLRTAPVGATPARRPARSPSLRRRRRVAVALVGVLSLSLVAAGGTVAAAQDAVPDDALYGVKRTSERAWLAVPRNATGTARAELTLAERRLDEVRRAPEHADELTALGIQHAAAAEDELPEDALRAFERLLGDGEGRLPEQASPRARMALHRNCVRLSGRVGADAERCGPAPEDVHPGRGVGRGGDPDRTPPGLRDDGERPGRGFGPGGRPEGDTGPRGRGFGPGGRPEGETGPPAGVERGPRGRGFGPGGRPEGTVGPPPGVRPLPGDRLDDVEDGTRRPGARRPVEPPAIEDGSRAVPDLDTDPETGPPTD